MGIIFSPIIYNKSLNTCWGFFITYFLRLTNKYFSRKHQTL